MWISKKRVAEMNKRINELEEEVRRQRTMINLMNYPYEDLKKIFENELIAIRENGPEDIEVWIGGPWAWR